MLSVSNTVLINVIYLKKSSLGAKTKVFENLWPRQSRMAFSGEGALCSERALHPGPEEGLWAKVQGQQEGRVKQAGRENWVQPEAAKWGTCDPENSTGCQDPQGWQQAGMRLCHVAHFGCSVAEFLSYHASPWLCYVGLGFTWGFSVSEHVGHLEERKVGIVCGSCRFLWA